MSSKAKDRASGNGQRDPVGGQVSSGQTHTHTEPTDDVVVQEFQRRGRAMLIDVIENRRPAEALRQGAAAVLFFEAYVRAQKIESGVQRLLKQSIKDRGRRATVLLGPDYKEIDRRAKTMLGGIPNMTVNVYQAADYDARERVIDAFLRGDAIVSGQLIQFAADLEQMATKVEERKVVRIARQGICDPLTGTCMCPCDGMWRDANVMRNIMDVTCALAAGCAIVPGCQEIAGIACASAATTWLTMIVIAESCSAYYQC